MYRLGPTNDSLRQGEFIRISLARLTQLMGWIDHIFSNQHDVVSFSSL